MKPNILSRLLLVLCLLLSVGSGTWLARNKAVAPQAVTSVTLQRDYPLVSQHVLTDDPRNTILNFVPLRKQLQDDFNALAVQKSFYFEYLASGTSIRIGGDTVLVAASLIKVPLAMNLYKAAELGEVDLDMPVAITTSELDNAYGNLWQKGAGTMITLRQASRLALTQSDNTAAHVMFDHVQGLLTVDQESLNQLDIDQNTQDGQAVIDAKSYSSILKSLYLSSYLSPKDSQALLGYLTQSTATNRLIAGVPKNVPVAHKIGVYNASWSESDCGIVYATGRPYVLCAMVGLPEDQANAFIAKVSKEVYDYVSDQ